VAVYVDLENQNLLAWIQGQASRLRQAATSRGAAVGLVRRSLLEYSEIGPNEAAAISGDPLRRDEILGDWFLPPAPESSVPSRLRNERLSSST
jgi:hypothetical protein